MKKPLTEEIEEQILEEFEKKFVKINMKDIGEAVGMTLNNEILFSGKQKDFEIFLLSALSKQRKELLELVIESLPKEKEITVQADGQYHFVENTKVISYNTCLTEVKDLISKMTF